MSNTDDLFTWLQGIQKNIASKPTASAKEFVEGMYRRELCYHWEDDAHDCLSGLIDTYTGDLLNEIVSEMFNEGEGENMFNLALDLANADDPALKAMKQLATVLSPGSDDYAEVMLAIDKRKLELGITEPCVDCGDVSPHKMCATLTSSGTDDESRFCTCDIKDLATWGCKCGGC